MSSLIDSPPADFEMFSFKRQMSSCGVRRRINLGMRVWSLSVVLKHSAGWISLERALQQRYLLSLLSRVVYYSSLGAKSSGWYLCSLIASKIRLTLAASSFDDHVNKTAVGKVQQHK